MHPNLVNKWVGIGNVGDPALRAYARWEYGSPEVGWLLSSVPPAPQRRRRPLTRRVKLWIQAAASWLL